MKINMIHSLEQTRVLRDQFVKPVYLSLLHANFAHRTELYKREHSDSEVAATRALIATGAKVISDEQLDMLLAEREWRGRLAAAWFVGLSKRVAFVEKIAGLLLSSELVYAGQGFCVALALIGNDTCRRHLRAYLSKYLPIQGRFYDQEWAIGALAHIERNPPEEFLIPELWAEGQGRMNPSNAIERFSKLIDYLDEHQMRAFS